MLLKLSVTPTVVPSSEEREYQSHIRAKERADKRIVGTEQTRQAAAHEEAFNLVVDIHNTHVIERNEVMQL